MMLQRRLGSRLSNGFKNLMLTDEGISRLAACSSLDNVSSCYQRRCFECMDAAQAASSGACVAFHSEAGSSSNSRGCPEPGLSHHASPIQPSSQISSTSFALLSASPSSSPPSPLHPTWTTPWPRSLFLSSNPQFPSRSPPTQPHLVASRCFASSVPPSLGKEAQYALGIAEYNQLMRQISYGRKSYLLRDVYEDMLMDGVAPNRDTFHFAITGAMRGNQLQDVFFFFNEMKTSGMLPDVVIYNCVITACGMCAVPDRAFKVAEEMESMGVQPKLRTYLALLKACGMAGRVYEAYGVIQRMSSTGLSLDEHCYAALITAFKNRRPVAPDTFEKIFELVEQAKMVGGGRKGAGAREGVEERGDAGMEVVDYDGGEGWRGKEDGEMEFVYRSALRAMIDLRNMSGVQRLLEMIEKDGVHLDKLSYVALIKAYANARDLDNMQGAFNSLISVGGKPTLETYLAMIEGCIRMFKPEAMEVAKQLLAEMAQKGFFLNTRNGGHLLELAASERSGDLSCAKAIFDLLKASGNSPPFQPTATLLRGLLYRGATEDDKYVIQAREILRVRSKKQVSRKEQTEDKENDEIPE